MTKQSVRKAKLFIKGLKDPIIMSEEKGMVATRIIQGKEDDLQYGNLSSTSAVTLYDEQNKMLWSGIKGDMRYVEYFTDKKEIVVSREDLSSFGQMIEPYLVAKGNEDYNELVSKLANDIAKPKKTSVYSPAVMNKIKIIREKNLNEVDIKIEASKIADEHFIGMLTQKGENRFLQDRGAIRICKDGNIAIKKNVLTGDIPYEKYKNLISLWLSEKESKSFGIERQIEGYEDLVKQVHVDNEPDTSNW